MKSKYCIGQTVYIVGNNRFIIPMIVVNYAYGLYTLKFINRNGGIRLKEERLFETEEAASICL
ncbi:MAG: hypothetical protein Q4E33_01985 [Erysipelotrichaceae bacterium]|nr:hypothetical protein [Erysipelotrichaceae bacterium]